MPTFSKLATLTGNGSSQFSFTSIPQTFDDLVIMLSGCGNRTDYEDWINVRANNASSGYIYKGMYWANQTGSIGSSTNGQEAYGYVSATIGTSNSADVYLSSNSFYLSNYANAVGSKLLVAWGGGIPFTNGQGQTGWGGGAYINGAAVTSLQVIANNSTGWTSSSTVSLYGIKRT
jgi:hypothetical protein